MPRISQLPSLTTADNADEIAIVDVSASTTKKITRGDILKAPLPNNSVTTAAIADASITNAKLSTTAGEPGGAWVTWTPTWENLTKGSGGVVTALYTQVGKTVHARVHFKFGTGSAVSGDISVSLPVPARAYAGTGNLTQIGNVGASNGSALFFGFVSMANTSKAILRMIDATPNVAAVSVIGPTIPFTWATDHELTATFTYEAS